MTKIGEGGMKPPSSDAIYQKQLQESISHFENALCGYQSAQNDEEKGRLKDIMYQQMDLIRSAVAEIKLLGVNKQGTLVQHDFERYTYQSSPENLNALEHDLATLREYTHQPEKG
jgi:hypothetical protein